jgi:hypothetical protein
MLDDLRRWSDLLCRGASTEEMVAALGEADERAGPTQIPVRPRSAHWAGSEIVQRSVEEGPDHIRLQPAAHEALTAPAVEEAFGAPVTTPPRLHFDDPEQRIYQVDPGDTPYTVALIAQLKPGHDDGVLQGIVLRRDIRLD